MKRISWHMKRNQFQHSIYRLSWPRMRNSWIWYPFPSYCARIQLYLHALIRDARQRDTSIISISPGLLVISNSNRKKQIIRETLCQSEIKFQRPVYTGRLLPIQLIGTQVERERERRGLVGPLGRATLKLESWGVLSLLLGQGSQNAHLQITAAARGGVLQHPDLKLLEAYSQNPVSGRPAKGTEAVPAREGFTPIRWGHRRTRHIFVNVHRLIAVASVRWNGSG